MIRIIGSLLIIISATSIGFFYGDNLKKRVYELHEFEKSIYYLKNEMFYTNTSLPEAFASIGKKIKGNIKDIFLNASKILKLNNADSVYEALKLSIEKQKNFINLNEDDIDVILNFAKSVGNSNADSQQGIFLLTLENLKKQIENAEITMNKNIKVYRYLGFSAGFIIVIILL